MAERARRLFEIEAGGGAEGAEGRGGREKREAALASLRATAADVAGFGGGACARAWRFDVDGNDGCFRARYDRRVFVRKSTPIRMLAS